MRDFTPKQRKFISAYIICMNATEAARQAGYSGSDNVLAVAGHRLLRNAKVKAEIDRIFNEHAMNAQEVLMRLSAQARGDITDLIDPITNAVDWNKAKALGVTHLIRKVKQQTTIRDGNDDESETHTLEIELYNSQEALKTLAKYHQLLATKLVIEDWRTQAISDIKSGRVQYDDLVGLFDRDLATELFITAGVPISVDNE